MVEGTTDKKDRSQQKNDERDAWALAERLRTGTVKNRVIKPPRELSRLRDAVRTYGIVVGDLVRVKNRLNAVYRYQEPPPFEKNTPPAPAAKIRSLPVPHMSYSGPNSEAGAD